MPYTTFGASRSTVDHAGDVLRQAYGDPSSVVGLELAAAEACAQSYRAEFQEPLTKVVMGLRSFLKTEGIAPVVAQRLKRLPTIADKLTRLPSMRLTQMQDIGGCRVVLAAGDFRGVQKIRSRIALRKWEVVAEQDYNARPKATGYRAHHVVVLRDGRLVEIQLRTAGQQGWAEGVERIGSWTGMNVKDGDGPRELLRYLELAAVLTDQVERNLDRPDDVIQEMLRLAPGVRQYLVPPSYAA